MSWLERIVPRLCPQRLSSLPGIGRFAHLLRHPHLWRLRRESVARGAAAGVFFAFATPVAQIPAALACALVLRMHLPTAALATLVNTPLTFAPVYYAAYRVGAWLTGATSPHAPEAAHQGVGQGAAALFEAVNAPGEGVTHALLAAVIGALVFAVLGAAIAYAGVHLFWRLKAVRRASRWAQLRTRRMAASTFRP